MPRRGNGASSYRAFQAMQRGGARAMKAQAKRDAVKVIPQSTTKTTTGLVMVKAYTKSNGIQVKAATRKRPGSKSDGWSGHRMRASKNSWNPWS